MRRLFLLLTLTVLVFFVQAQKAVNWTNRQVMEPAELAKVIEKNNGLPVIVCVGPGAIIPYSLDAGMAGKDEGKSKFKSILSNIPKDTKIVIYCGCCPFDHCPNIRPAVDVLKELNFTNFYILNLPHNLKTDWIAKGYPVKKD